LENTFPPRGGGKEKYQQMSVAGKRLKGKRKRGKCKIKKDTGMKKEEGGKKKRKLEVKG
jgi:hypothetical protein